jgi:hypothetical protein
MEYCEVVARWNDTVGRSTDGTFDFVAYCAFLLQTYDTLRAPIALAPAT